jgi:hypothetical protein
MRTVTAKQFSNVPTWQADSQAKQAKKAAKQQRDQRKNKRLQWES